MIIAALGRMRAHRWVLVPVLLYALAAWWLTHRLWVHPAHLVVADNPDDSANFAWFLTWTPWSIAHGHSPLFTHLLNAPDGVNLMWNTSMPLVGLVFAPLTYAFGAAWVVTLLTALGPFASALSGMTVARVLGASRVPAVLGGLLFGFSPAMTAKSLGHINLTMQPLLPVLLLLAVRLTAERRTRWRDAALLGVLATAQLLVNEELLLLTGIALLLVLVVLAARRGAEWHRHLETARAYLLALGVFAVLAGPLLWFQVKGPQHGSGAPYTVGYYKADLSSYVVPSRLQLLASGASKHEASSFTGGITEQTAYLGWPLLVLGMLALVVCWRDLRVRATLIPAAVLGFLALGPVLAMGGKDTSQHLPWGWISHLPLVQNALASRLPLLTDLLLAAGLCFALDSLLKRHRGAGLAAGALWLLAFLPILPATLRVAPIAATPRFFTTHAVDALARDGSVLVLPYPTGTVTEPVRWQAASALGFSMPGGYFIGPAADGRLYVGGQPRPSQPTFAAISQSGVVPIVTAELRSQVTDDLSFWKARAIVLGPSPHEAELASFVTRVLGRAPRSSGGVLIWAVS